MNSWHQAYKKLMDFIAEHPDIKLDQGHVYIPENARLKFFQFFDSARMAFIEEEFPHLLNESTNLSNNYLKAEGELIKLLGLEDVSHIKPVYRFLHNPIDELKRELFDLTFDLLKTKIDTETFENNAAYNIESYYRNLHLLSYEKWVIICLMKILAADKNFQVNVRHIDRGEHSLIASAASEEEVSPPQESSHLSFDNTGEELFAVVDFIIHSSKIDKYIAFRSDVNKAIATASNASSKREWYPNYSAITFGYGLTLVYLADKTEEISLVADAKRFCRPDLLIECREQKDWYENNGLEKVKLHHRILRPRLGTYIVSKEEVPEQVYKEFMQDKESVECITELNTYMESTEKTKPVPKNDQSPALQKKTPKKKKDIRVLIVGFDQSKLEPLANFLI
jgi:hypothetical protein